MNEPLKGIRVIDQTQALAGPYCSMILGDLGAEVIKLERPGVGDQSRSWGPPFLGSESAYYLAVNRNKRGMTLNVSSVAGQEILHKLTDSADIFLTNLPTLAHFKKYNIDYETLSGRNKGLIYGAISGYGHTGPKAGQPGYDLAAQGESGTMYLTGDPDGSPMRFPTPIADMTTGLFMLVGILSALYARHASGEGQFIDCSLLESQMTWLENYAGEYFATGEDPPRRGSSHPQVVPYEPMEGSDGIWFILGVGSDNLWGKFCDLTGLAELKADPRFVSNADRVNNRDELLPQVRAHMKTKSSAEWLTLLANAGIPSGPIRTVGEALADPQIIARNFIVELEHPSLGMIKSLATPIHMSKNQLTFRKHPPTLGEESEVILAELGYSQAQIDQHLADGII
ncbi:MAG: crotonobetainyl-CoA:carnitine CoA-transferase CaiB-like acyl-CoA transferase [Cellvibrionaceae bacterium]|jgi:crotonobetainyl-CoA:carnitine CoA-transferase CaiB-like acyl-CoA transferase